jgi:hypothetical protein
MDACMPSQLGSLFHQHSHRKSTTGTITVNEAVSVLLSKLAPVRAASVQCPELPAEQSAALHWYPRSGPVRTNFGERTSPRILEHPHYIVYAFTVSLPLLGFQCPQLAHILADSGRMPTLGTTRASSLYQLQYSTCCVTDAHTSCSQRCRCIYSSSREHLVAERACTRGSGSDPHKLSFCLNM